MVQINKIYNRIIYSEIKKSSILKYICSKQQNLSLNRYNYFDLVGAQSYFLLNQIFKPSLRVGIVDKEGEVDKYIYQPIYVGYMWELRFFFKSLKKDTFVWDLLTQWYELVIIVKN